MLARAVDEVKTKVKTYLLDGLEVVLHALDSDVLASLYGLGFEHF